MGEGRNILMFTGVHILKASALGLEMMAQWSRTLISLSEDQSLEPTNQIGQLKKAWNSSPKVSVFLLASVGACVQAHTHTHSERDRHKKKKSRNPLKQVPFWEIRRHLEDDFGHKMLVWHQRPCITCEEKGTPSMAQGGCFHERLHMW